MSPGGCGEPFGECCGVVDGSVVVGDLAPVGGDLVGAVDGEVEAVDAGGLFDGQAEGAGGVLGGGGAGAQADGHAVADQFGGCLGGDLLLALNAHDRTPPDGGRDRGTPRAAVIWARRSAWTSA
jgi:hypothetical protein